MNSSSYLLIACVLILLLPGCDSSSNEASNSIIGRWSLVKENGQDLAEGIFVIWDFSQDILRVESDLDCTSLNSYMVSGETLTITVNSLQGSQCGNEVGDVYSFDIVIDGNTLTVDSSDLFGFTAIQIFERA